MLTYCGDLFTTYKNLKSLCCILETKIMLYINYTSILKKENMITIILILKGAEVDIYT